MSDALDQLLAADDAATAAGTAPKGGGLRKQLEDALAERQQLTERLAAFEAKQRQTDLNALFTQHSIPAKAAAFFPKETEPTAESVAAWAAEYAELWGGTPAVSQPAVVPAAEQSAALAMQQVAATAATQSLKPRGEDEYRALFAGAKNKADLERLMSGLVIDAGV